MKGSISGLGKPVPPVKTASPSPAPGTPLQNTDDLARKVAEAKRRVADAQTKLAVKDNPYMVSPVAIHMFACFRNHAFSQCPRRARRTSRLNQPSKVLG